MNLSEENNKLRKENMQLKKKIKASKKAHETTRQRFQEFIKRPSSLTAKVMRN